MLSKDPMNNAHKKQLSSISQADTIEGIGEYWDNHSLTEHWAETREVTFVVRARPRPKKTTKEEEQ